MQNPFNAPTAARTILGWAAANPRVDPAQAATEIAWSLSWQELIDAMHHLPERDGLGHMETLMRSHIRAAITEALERERLLLPALECLQDGDDCQGEVEMHSPPGRSDGRSFPRCLHHRQMVEAAWDERVARGTTYTEASPPSWFDPLDAGEDW